MSSNDVRSIMGLASNSTASTSTSHHKGTRVSTRKPEGISRELYALIGDNAPSLQAAQLEHQTLKFKERPKLKRKAVKWEWKSFAPANRTGLQLAHWVKASDEAEDPFSKYNSTTPVMDFSQQEYDTNLRDEDWSQAETSYLFSLLREYDLRFVIVADRYAYPGDLGTEFLDLPEGGRKRTIEDIKSRYYSICRRLVRSRPTGDEQGKTTMLQYYAFDKERELARKNYASSLFHLTPSQIAEEEALYLECKRMEQQEKKFKADREDLMRMLAGFESGLIGLPGKAGGAAGAGGVAEVGGDKKRKDVLGLDGPSGAMSSKKAEKNAKQDLLHCIHRLPLPQPSALSGHTLKSSSGPPTLPNLPVYLRSTRLPVPSKPSLTQPILALLSELTPPVPLPGKLVMPTRGSLERLEGLMAASQGLVEMKRNVDRVEQEVRILKARVEAKRVEEERERGAGGAGEGGEGGAMEGVEEAAAGAVREGEGLVDAAADESDAAGKEIDVDAAGEEAEEGKEKVEKEGDASIVGAETTAAGEASTSTEEVVNP
ncbi:hypothetical protein BDY24DRAFT_416629 [Mrakia frigida]|uniref:Swc4p n=1 Tax=Mrakia frigida TaxID=29902 RepID=UPI003FCC128C